MFDQSTHLVCCCEPYPNPTLPKPHNQVLNPPCLSELLLATLRFEFDAPFPGSSPAERLAFAKRWYSTAPRQPPFDGWRVPARFTHLPDRSMWMERFALFNWLVLLFRGTASLGVSIGAVL